jgi:hypothetical protein
LGIVREVESEGALWSGKELVYEVGWRCGFCEIFEIGEAGYFQGAVELGGFKGVEEGCEIVFCEIEEVAVCCECEERTEEDHWTDLRFSDAEGFWNLLTFLEIEMMCVGEQSMKSK